MVDSPLSLALPSQLGARRSHTPTRDAHLDHLALKELRGYRDELAQEETRVAYCRRVLRIQLEITRAGRRDQASDLAFSRALRRGAHSRQFGAGRDAILALVPAGGLPAMPDLSPLPGGAPGKARSADPPEPDGHAAAVLLLAIDGQLAGYQDAVRLRISAATVDLIARYRESPALAVRALPVRPVVPPRQVAC